MATPNWTLFATVVVLATTVLLVLSRASARLIWADEPPDESIDGRGPPGASDAADPPAESGEHSPSPPIPTGVALLANVALTHGALGVGLVALVWYASIPLASLGVSPVSVESVAAGLALGVGLYLASEAGTAVADRAGIEYDEHLRESLAPDRPAEWALLLLVILPVIAGAEEFLFRGILVGALATGFGLPAWALVLVSSVLFGLGHSAQGTIGIAVTAALGLVLAVAFVLTGSLAVVVIAHYAVDALEFVIREGVLG